MKSLVKCFGRKMMRKQNVVGFSATYKKKIVSHIETSTPAIRIYVSKKLPLCILEPEDVIPERAKLGLFTSVKTDVVEIGEIKALAVQADAPQADAPDKTQRFRPVQNGVSIGNAQITAGTLGGVCVKDNRKFFMSNAHVLARFPMNPPEEQEEKRILQPGSAHGGTVENDIAAEYAWHKQIMKADTPQPPSDCPIVQLVVGVLNGISRLLGSRSRVSSYSLENTENFIDFAVARPTVPFEDEYADGSIPPDAPFIGLLFAGSSFSGIICKAKHIEATGHIPTRPSVEVGVGDTVRGCSFWCNFTTKVLDESAEVQVNYGGPTVVFSDQIIVQNQNDEIKGGCSGSGWFRVTPA